MLLLLFQGDYVCRQESWPGRGTYDVILCLGVTKWVQLQSGDAGVVRLFKRAFQSLSPGGMFILESQPWSSYGHSKKASVTTATRTHARTHARAHTHTQTHRFLDTRWNTHTLW